MVSLGEKSTSEDNRTEQVKKDNYTETEKDSSSSLPPMGSHEEPCGRRRCFIDLLSLWRLKEDEDCGTEEGGDESTSVVELGGGGGVLMDDVEMRESGDDSTDAETTFSSTFYEGE